MGAYISITELVEHTVTESSQGMKDTELEVNWCFYHDALLLMTAKETIPWIRANVYYKCWMLPELALHADDPDLANSLHQPFGNSPEMMPWDISLNQDVHVCLSHHDVATNDYPKDKHTKFDLSTPTHAGHAYCRNLKICSPLPPNCK